MISEPWRGGDGGMVLEARAKINLHLRALGRRSDGYTEILTVFQEISLADRVAIRPRKSGLEVACRHPEVPAGEGNIAWRAADLFFRRRGLAGGAAVSIEKRIPVSAGLGGGSSDAAAVLLGLNSLHGSPYEPPELSALAAELGSDVPFFLRGGTALGKGRGEIVEPLTDQPPVPLVLLFPGLEISAAEAYGRLPAVLTGEDPDISMILGALERRDILSAASHLANDLQPGVLTAHQEVRETLEEIAATGAAVSMMSGSGSACFGLYREEQQATEAGRLLSGRGRRQVIRAAFSPRQNPLSPWMGRGKG